jgi:hypothetical protein
MISPPAYLFYTSYFSLLLLLVFLLFLPCLVDPSNETFDIALVSKTVLMMLSRGRIIRDVGLTILAEVFLLGDPIFTHSRCSRMTSSCDRQVGMTGCGYAADMP